MRLGVLLADRETSAGTATERIDPATGRILWQRPAPGRSSSEPLLAAMRTADFVTGAAVYFANEGHLSAHDVKTGKNLWSVRLAMQELWEVFPGNDSTVVVFGLGSDNRIVLMYLDSRTGATRLEQALGGRFGDAWGLRCDDTPLVIVLAPDVGDLYVYDLSGRQTRKLDDLFINLAHSNIALHGDTLLHLEAGTLHAYAVPALTERWQVAVNKSVYLIDEVQPPAVVLGAVNSNISYAPPAGK